MSREISRDSLSPPWAVPPTGSETCMYLSTTNIPYEKKKVHRKVEKINVASNLADPSPRGN